MFSLNKHKEIKTSELKLIKQCSQLCTIDFKNDNYVSVLNEEKLTNTYEDVIKFSFCSSFEGCIVYDADNVYVIIYGTNEIKDLKTDLSFKLDNYNTNTNKKIKIHAGFLKTVLEHETKLTALLNDIPNIFSKKITITGHSLGGALAIVYAFILQEIINNETVFIDNLKIENVVTFGSPRVGNSAFVDTFKNMFSNEQFIRVVNKSDIIPLLPLLIQRYRHVYSPYYINNKNKLIKYPYITYYIYNMLQLCSQLLIHNKIRHNFTNVLSDIITQNKITNICYDYLTSAFFNHKIKNYNIILQKLKN